MLASKRFRGVLAVAALLGGVAVGALLVLLLGGGEEQRLPDVPARLALGLSLTATDEDGQGIGPTSHFVLTSRSPLSVEQVGAALAVKPEVEFRLERAAATEFHLIPIRPLEPDRVYHFTYRMPDTRTLEASWAFQVRGDLRVVGTLPGHETSNVPLDSGIEIIFSHDGVLNPQDFVEISPMPEGHFELHKRTLVFVPRALAAETLYTVRLRPGVQVPGSSLMLDEEVVFQFETGNTLRFAPSLGPPRLDFLHRVSEAGTAEPPLVSIWTSDSALNTLQVNVYAYPSLTEFVTDLEARDEIPVWAAYTRARSAVDTSKLALAMSFDATIEGRAGPTPQQWGGIPTERLFFRFPTTLPEGLYLLETRFRDQPVRAWLQITDVATYLAVSTTSTLVWVNDVTTGQPIAGARIEAIGRSALGQTDGEGIASFTTPDYLSQTVSRPDRGGGLQSFGMSFLLITDERGRQAIVPISPVLPPSLMSGRCGAFTDFGFGYAGYDYWNFTSTDRPLYQPTDTVNFWGVAKAREGDPEREFTVRLLGYPNEGPRLEVSAGSSTVRTTDLGTFTGEFKLDGVDPGYYTIQLYDGERVINGVGFRVEPYIKPPYQLSLMPVRPAYFAGEMIEIDVEATFFEGTPLPNLRLGFTTQEGHLGEVTTDSNGRGRITYPAGMPGVYGDYIAPSYVTVSPVAAEAGAVVGHATIGVFPAAVQPSAKASYLDGTVTVTGDVYRVDPERWADRQTYGFYFPPPRPAYLVAPVAGATVHIEVVETSYDAIPIGEYYDFVNKISRPLYRYEPRETPVTSETAVTNGNGNYSFSFPARAAASYRISVRSTDDAGRTHLTQTFAYGATFATFSGGGMAYLTADNSQNIYFSRPPFAIGETFEITMKRGETPLPSGGNNRYLFYEGQLGIRHHEVRTGPVYSGAFDERHVPSATIGGVYFNGFTYVEAQYGPTLIFNPEERRLSIEITAAQPSYEPGDEALVNVTVRDRDGRPKAAEVRLTAVDEAIFALGDFYGYQTAILEQLYQSVPSGIIRTYASHQYPPQLLEPGGRGGDGGARQDFRDTAFVETVRTDASGRAQVRFKLPDNLTSWRISAYAVSSDLYAGTGRGPVVVRLPFFVDISLNDTYLLADKPVATARAFGSALNGGETVEFTLKAPTLGLADGVRMTGRPFERVNLPLPPLALGEHEITIEARSGSFEDAILKTVRVVSSRLTMPEVRFYESVASGQRLEGSRGGRTTVVFLDGGRGQMYPMLQQLRWSYGDRVDQAVARYVAAGLLQEYFGESGELPMFEPTTYTTRQRVPFQNPSLVRGVGILPFADADLGITAHVAALAPDVFGRTFLKNALSVTVNDPGETPERAAIAFFGLAALDEPVLVQVRALAQSPDLGWRGRLYVALALEAAGDHSGAAAVLDALYNEFGETLRTERRLRVGVDQDDTLEATALAAMVAAGVGDARAESFMRYVQSNATRDVLLSLSELTYAQKTLDRLAPESARFTVTVDGRREVVSLAAGVPYSLSLSPAQLASMAVEVLDGRLSATTRFMAPLAEADLERSADVGISRTILVDGRADGMAGPNSLIQVTLDFDIGPQAPDGCYQITDYLPSGLQPVTRVQTLFTDRMAGQPGGYFLPGLILPYLTSSQKVSFCISRGPVTRISYYARPVAAGEYVWEPATIHNQRVPTIFNLTPSTTLRVE